MHTLLAFRHTILMLALTAVLMLTWRYSTTELGEVVAIVAACCAAGAVVMFFIDTVWQHYDKEVFGDFVDTGTRDDC